MPWKLSEWIQNDADQQELEAYRPDEQTLRRIGLLAREKAENPPKEKTRRRIRPALPVLVAAIVLLMGLATALAATDLGTAVANAFSGSEEMTQRLAVLGLYGDAIGQEREDNGIVAAVESAYADETGFILLFRLDDPQGRLSENSAIKIDWQTDIGGASWSTKIQRDEETGQLYAMLNLISGKDMRGKKFDFAITRLDGESIYVESHPVNVDVGASADALPMPLTDLPVNMPPSRLTGVYLREGTAVIEVQSFSPDPNLDPQQRLEHISLRAPDGAILSAQASSLRLLSDPDSSVTVTAFFPGFERLEDLSGYTLCICYSQVSGMIEGNWDFHFRLPKDDAVTDLRFNEAFEAGGKTVVLERVRINRTSVIVEYSRPDEPGVPGRGPIEIAPPDRVNEYDDWWFDEANNDQLPYTTIVDAQGNELPFFSTSGDRNERGVYRDVMACNADAYDELYLCFREKAGEGDVFKVRIK